MDNSSYEDGFRIEYNENSGGWTEITPGSNTVGAGVTTYLHTVADTTHTFEYRVKAHVGATLVNAELFSDIGSDSELPEGSLYYVISGSSSQVAGATQTLQFTLKDTNGYTATFWSGDKQVKITGANTALSGTQPTCTDKTGAGVNLGTSTTITFASGVGSCSLALYKVESAAIAVTDGTHSSSSTLSISVTGGPLNGFLVDTPDSATTSIPFSVSIYARDAWLNNTISVSGNTTLTSNYGSTTPATLADTEFTDDGIWVGDVTIGSVVEQPTVTLQVQNGAITGSDLVVVLGKPNAPGSVSASYQTDAWFQITWADNSGIETGYLVERNTDTGSGFSD